MSNLFNEMMEESSEKDKKIADLEAKLAESEKAYTDLKELEQATKESLYASREYLDQLKSEKWDLEKQLAEKEFAHNSYFEKAEETIRFLQQQFNEKGKIEEQLEELKYQLIEKEKELHYKTAECEKWKADYENCSKLEKTITKERQYCLDNWRASEQDKISFALEQLKKVKNKFNGKRPIDDLANEVGLELGYTATQIQKYIDNQIEELKKEMK